MHAETDHSTRLSASLHPLLRNAGVEGCAIVVRLGAYVGTLGTIACLAVYLWSSFAPVRTAKRGPASHLADPWTQATRPQPAFAIPAADLAGKTETYGIQRHVQGGRKDTLRFNEPNGGPVIFEIELYRPGSELGRFQPATDEIANRFDASAGSAGAIGVAETKLGPVQLVSFVRNTGAALANCTGFARDFETPRLLMTGFSCQGTTPQLQRRAIACAVDRLTMLSAGNDAAFAALFANAELRRTGCGAAQASADWITATRDLNLRGSLGSITR